MKYKNTKNISYYYRKGAIKQLSNVLKNKYKIKL